MAVNTEKFAAVLRELGVPGQVRELAEPAPTAAAAAELLRITGGTPADVGA